MVKRILLKLILLSSLILILTITTSAQGNALSGTINSASDCFSFSVSAHYPAHTVTFTVTTSGNYAFTNVSNDYSPPTTGAWFYIFAGTYDPLVPHNLQPSFLVEGPAGTVRTLSLTAGINYIMVTNNDERYLSRTTCLNRTTTVTGNYVQSIISGTGAICTGGSCVASSAIVAGQSDCPVFFDGRINDCDTFNPVVLYGYQDDNENRGLDVYGADGEGLLFRVTAEEIANVAQCPDSNSTIAYDSTTGIGLYRLTERPDGTCPFQLNAPTGESAKVYVVIFDTLYPHTNYESFEDVFGA